MEVPWNQPATADRRGTNLVRWLPEALSHYRPAPR